MLHTDPVPVQCHWSMHILEERSEWRWILQLPHLHPCELVLWLPLNEVSEVRKCDKMDAGFDELTATCGRTLTTNGEETVHHIVSRGWHYDCHIDINNDQQLLTSLQILLGTCKLEISAPIIFWIESWIEWGVVIYMFNADCHVGVVYLIMCKPTTLLHAMLYVLFFCLYCRSTCL